MYGMNTMIPYRKKKKSILRGLIPLDSIDDDMEEEQNEPKQNKKL